MSIRMRLHLLVMLPLVLALVFGVVSYETSRRLQQAQRKVQLSQEINKNLFELSLRTSRYAQGEINSEAWWHQHRKLAELFQQRIWNNRAEDMVVRWLRQHHVNLGSIFRQVLAVPEGPETPATAELQEQHIRHLLERTQVMVSQAYILETVSHAEVRDLQRQAILVIGITLGVLAGSMILLAALLGRSILLPLQRLQEGARTVADGKLSYKVPVNGNDEVAALAQAFNEMTEHLKDSYSKLESEIAERKDAQAALARHRDELEAEVARRTAELKQLNMMLTAIRSVDQLMTKGRNQQVLLEETCRILRDICGHAVAWIVLTDAAGKPTTMEYAGIDADAAELLNTLRRGWPCQCAKAALTDGTIQIVEAGDPTCAGCSMQVPHANTVSMTARLQYGSATFGVIGVSSPGDFIGGGDAHGLFQELADDVALALHNLDLQRQRDEAEAQRKQNLAELARSNAELQQFAYVASHDLQEPLRGIAGCLQLLQQRYRDNIDDLANQLIDHAVAGATRMRALIQDLLRYSRVGTREQRFGAVDLGEVLADVRRDLQVAIAESHAQIEADPLPMVEGDAVQLSQVLQNLIGNAIKFHGEAPPRVRIRCTDAGDVWHLAVEDQGLGIDAKYKERIFEVFQRLHTRTEFPGTGMGLAICKKIMERHNGRIWLDPDSADGATFHLVLPKARSPVAAEEPADG